MRRRRKNMKKCGWLAFVAMGLLPVITAAPGRAQVAAPPYKLQVFAKAPAGLSAPDSIAVLGDRVFVGYGDGHAPDGSDGLSSQIVEYRMDGSIVQIFTVLGHNDGLKVDPLTHHLWALQNEDANPRLVIFNLESGDRKLYLFGPTPHGGGYDDMVFRGCDVYISASNPANNPNAGPAIVSVHLEGNLAEVEPLLAAEANAIDIPTGAKIQLNLQDPDSMTLDPLGNVVLDSQADQEIIVVTNPGTPDQRALRVPLSYIANGAQTAVETDDTAFATSSRGFLLFADKGLNTVFKLTKDAFAPGSAYTAADGGPFVGTLDFTSGIITPVVTGLSGPGGMLFVDTSDHGPVPEGDWSRERDEHGDACRDRGWNPW
jgi:hypothetical protein